MDREIMTTQAEESRPPETAPDLLDERLAEGFDEPTRDLYYALPPTERGFVAKILERARGKSSLERARAYRTGREALLERAQGPVAKLAKEIEAKNQSWKDANDGITREQVARDLATAKLEGLILGRESTPVLKNLDEATGRNIKALEKKRDAIAVEVDRLQENLAKALETQGVFESKLEKAEDRLDPLVLESIAENGRLVDAHRAALREIETTFEVHGAQLPMAKQDLEGLVRKLKESQDQVAGTAAEQTFKSLVAEAESKLAAITAVGARLEIQKKDAQAELRRLENENRNLVRDLSERKVKELLEDPDQRAWLEPLLLKPKEAAPEVSSEQPQTGADWEAAYAKGDAPEFKFKLPPELADDELDPSEAADLAYDDAMARRFGAEEPPQKWRSEFFRRFTKFLGEFVTGKAETESVVRGMSGDKKRRKLGDMVGSWNREHPQEQIDATTASTWQGLSESGAKKRMIELLKRGETLPPEKVKAVKEFITHEFEPQEQAHAA